MKGDDTIGVADLWPVAIKCDSTINDWGSGILFKRMDSKKER
jgi:hypothetical protein